MQILRAHRQSHFGAWFGLGLCRTLGRDYPGALAAFERVLTLDPHYAAARSQAGLRAARQWLDMISGDADTPPSVRSRAEALQALLPPVAKS